MPEPGVTAIIKSMLPREEMIAAVSRAFDAGSHSVRIGAADIGGVLRLVSGEPKGDEIYEDGPSLLGLRELLDIFSEGRFNFLFPQKGTEWVRNYAGLLIDAGAGGRVLTSAFHGRNLELLRGIMPGAAIAYSYMGLLGLYGMFKSGLIHLKKKFRYGFVQTYETIGPSYIASSGFVRYLEEHGVEVQVFVQNSEKAIKRLRDAGVHSFITEDPDFLRKYLY